jgi:predicted AlkP superfamily pyrophosphatase or phosphodiesterase
MRTFSLFTTTLFIAFLCSPALAQAPGHAQRAIIISIDGGRPDVILRAKAPNIRALMKDGSFSFWARTTEVSVTLPSHASMITGCRPEKHGINFNKDVPEDELVYPKVPTIFELAKRQGLSTAMASGKSKFIALCKPGSVDYPLVPEAKKSYTDTQVAENACKAIEQHRPQVMLIHFGGGDKIGHALGWGTQQQVDEIDVIDAGIGKVVDTLKKQGLYDSTLIILSADHGGAARSHGKDDPRSRHIPWIAVGPGIRKDFDLTTFKDLVINTEDTFATACSFMNISPGDNIDGKPITQMIQGAELLQSVPKSAATTRPAVSAAK